MHRFTTLLSDCCSLVFIDVHWSHVCDWLWSLDFGLKMLVEYWGDLVTALFGLLNMPEGIIFPLRLVNPGNTLSLTFFVEDSMIDRLAGLKSSKLASQTLLISFILLRTFFLPLI